MNSSWVYEIVDKIKGWWLKGEEGVKEREVLE